MLRIFQSSSALLETPQKIARSISKAVGKKVAKEALDHKGPKFEMVASVTLNLDECNDGRMNKKLYNQLHIKDTILI